MSGITLFCLFVFETGSHVAQAGIRLAILLPQCLHNSSYKFIFVGRRV
jgi:hypothetical protein